MFENVGTNRACGYILVHFVFEKFNMQKFDFDFLGKNKACILS